MVLEIGVVVEVDDVEGVIEEEEVGT